MNAIRLTVLAIFLGFLVAACGGGGGSSGGGGGNGSGGGGGGNGNGGSGSADASPGGMWFGQIRTNDQERAVIGLVTEDGRAHFFHLDDFSQFVGQVDVFGDEGDGDFTDFSVNNQGDLVVRAAEIDVEIKERSEMGGFYAVDGNTRLIGLVYSRYAETYERPSSIDVVSGMYRNSADALSDAVDEDDGDAEDFAEEQRIEINEQGMINSSTGAGPCAITGVIDLIETDYNAYQVDLNFADSSGDECTVGGRPLTGDVSGIATLLPVDDSGEGRDLLVFFLSRVNAGEGDDLAVILPFLKDD